MFDVLFDNMSALSPAQYYSAIAAVFLLILGIIVAFIWRRAVSRRVRTQTVAGGGGMLFGDVERMRKEGQITEEEYKNIKRKVAERALAESRQQRQTEQERLILQQAAFNADIVRELLPSEIREKQAASQQAPQPQISPPSPPAAVANENLGDPLAAAPRPTPPQPSMNMPRVVQTPKSELDLLYEKGAISKEEYERLKGYFKGKQN